LGGTHVSQLWIKKKASVKKANKLKKVEGERQKRKTNTRATREEASPWFTCQHPAQQCGSVTGKLRMGGPEGNQHGSLVGP